MREEAVAGAHSQLGETYVVYGLFDYFMPNEKFSYKMLDLSLPIEQKIRKTADQ